MPLPYREEDIVNSHGDPVKIRRPLHPRDRSRDRAFKAFCFPDLFVFLAVADSVRSSTPQHLLNSSVTPKACMVPTSMCPPG